MSKEFIVGYLILLLTALPWVSLFIGRFRSGAEYSPGQGHSPPLTTSPFLLLSGRDLGPVFPVVSPSPAARSSIWRERSKVWQSEESLFLIWFVLLFLFLTLFKVQGLPVSPARPSSIGPDAGRKMEKELLLFFGSLHCHDFGLADP